MSYNHTFYAVMKYPVPAEGVLFSYGGEGMIGSDVSDSSGNTIIDKDGSVGWSWSDHSSDIMEEYLSHIHKYRNIWRLMPFVEQVYVCNSMSFNALKKGSDIDIFLIVKDGKMWIARLGALVILTVLWIKRYGKRVEKKFCLSFLVTESHRNLYDLSLQGGDVYFHYWLMHLVPIYSRVAGVEQKIWRENSWLQAYFPLWNGNQSIGFDDKVIVGSSWFKSGCEWVLSSFIRWLVGDLIEKMIKVFWLPVIWYKKWKLWSNAKGIIISDTVMRFYRDKRKEYQVLYQVAYKGKKK